MEKVTVTSKGQITIPSKIRKTLNIVKGTNLIVVQEGDTLGSYIRDQTFGVSMYRQKNF
ncbi:MAG: AbrB/MazE/SpoVT family DNA-binding domain-containing protein [Nitrososphaeria archaeon]